MQNSVMVVNLRGLEKFISDILRAPETDGELSPELKMERDMSPFATLRVPIGRSRPIDFLRTHYYVTCLTLDELRKFLESEGLQFEDWFPHTNTPFADANTTPGVPSTVAPSRT